MDTEDISASDEKISRLIAAKKLITDLLSKYPENTYALLIFAGKAMISSPLTNDTSTLSDIVQSLDTKSIRE